VDEAETRSKELQDMLARQKVAFDMLMATRSNYEGDMQQQEQELQALTTRLQQVWIVLLHN
jgi:hypothetical protein